MCSFVKFCCWICWLKDWKYCSLRVFDWSSSLREFHNNNNFSPDHLHFLRRIASIVVINVCKNNCNLINFDFQNFEEEKYGIQVSHVIRRGYVWTCEYQNCQFKPRLDKNCVFSSLFAGFTCSLVRERSKPRIPKPWLTRATSTLGHNLEIS